MPPVAKAAARTGAMVALFPPADIAEQLAQPGGEPAGDLHVTLAYLGEAAAVEDVDRLRQAVAEWAARTAPIQGAISGVGHFTAGPEPVTYASVDCPALPAARERLIFEITSQAWQEPSHQHGFSPHITLAYDDRQATVPNVPVTFTTVTLALADQRETFPLAGARPEWVVPLWKSEQARIVYGVVLQPGIPDAHGDTLTPAEIEKAAHEYLVTSRKQDLQHNEQEAAVDVVESYVAPAELEVAGRRVLKGSWVMASYIRDDAIWAKVQKGDLTGYSIGGTAVRTP